jgi:hypothetical protein
MKETSSQEAGSNNSAILEMFMGEYDIDEWKALVREPIQNSGDAHGSNKNDGIITPKDRDVDMKFEVDTEKNQIEIVDNAGGMTEDTLGQIVTKIAETTKDEVGSGAGHFGIGLWLVAYLCESGGNGGLYIETKYEETGNSLATVLYPDGDTIEMEDNGEMFGEPDEVKEQVELSLKNTPPSQWSDEGGTILRLDEVKDEHMEELSDWDKVQEEMEEKFCLLSDKFNIEYVIDGESHEFDTIPWDEFKGEVVKEVENIPVKGEKFTGYVDKLVFFRLGDADRVPWGSNIPLVKTRAGFENPHMIIRNFSVPGAPSVTSEDSEFGAYAVVDTLCDEDNKEKINHASFKIDRFGDKVEIGEIVKEFHDDRMNIVEDSIPEEEIIESCKEGMVQLSKEMKKASEGGDISSFGVDYDPDGNISIDIKEDEVISRIERRNEFTDPEVVVRIEEKNWGDKEVISNEEIEINLDEENKVSHNLEENDSVLLDVTVEEKESGKEISSNSTGINVEKLGESGIHRKGGFSKKHIKNKELFLDKMNITGVEWVDEGPSFCVEESEDGYILEVNKKSPKLMEHVNLSNDRKSRKRQRRLFMKEAAISIVEKIMFDVNSDDIEMGHKAFKELKEEIKAIPVKIDK